MFSSPRKPKTISVGSYSSFESLTIEMYHSYSQHRSMNNDYSCYTVQNGDTIESVAAKFNMTPSDIVHLNRLNLRTLFTNQKITVKDTNSGKESIEVHDANIGDGDTKAETDDWYLETQLLPLRYESDYLKLGVRYVTDVQGVISGSILVTPNMISFIPALLDPVVMDVGPETFTVQLPMSKIAGISIYMDSSMMMSHRSQRKDMSSYIMSPLRNASNSTNNSFETDENFGSSIQYPSMYKDLFKGKVSKFKDDYECSYRNDGGQEQNKDEFRYLCVVASPRYRKVKTVYQTKDEYWFMLSAATAPLILNYLFSHGHSKFNVGDNVDPLVDWADDNLEQQHQEVGQSTSPVIITLKKRKLTRAHISDAIDTAVSKARFPEWEMINEDHYLFEVSCPLYGDVESSIITDEQVKELLIETENQTVGAEWELVYSTERHGWSLQTLYRNIFNFTHNPCVLLIKDIFGNKFGAFCSHHIHQSNYFYGDGTTFVFRWASKFQKFTFSGKNHYIMIGDPDFFCVGCSDTKNAIRLSRDLFKGRSDKCETFNSPALVESKNFEISVLEVWSFY